MYYLCKSVMSFNDVLRILLRDGWYEVRHTGGHMKLRHPTKNGQIVLPRHGKREIGKGLLQRILKDANIVTKGDA